MNKHSLLFKIFFSILLLVILQGNSDTTIKLEKLRNNNIAYFNLTEFLNKHAMSSNYYETKDKIEIVYKKNKIYLSPELSYIKINDQIYHLLYPILKKKNQFYIPAKSFYDALLNAELPLRLLKEEKNYLYVLPSIYNIIDLRLEHKQNGLLIELQTNNSFSNSNISSSFSSNNWLNITILNGQLDSLALHQIALRYPVSKLRTVQSKESAQISFLIDYDIEDIDIDISKNSISFLLRSAIADNAEKINQLRKKWLIDTIVIDAGHGGKDPGAIGHNVQEKNITLDIAKKLGALLVRNLGVNVIYTREEDVFIPLWKRTKIANIAEGKLFISIHANAASKSPRTKGYETYLLRPGKSN